MVRPAKQHQCRTRPSVLAALLPLCYKAVLFFVRAVARFCFLFEEGIMLMLRRSFLAVAAALCALTAGAENAKVKVGFIALPSHAPNFLAKERGFYAEEGLDAELVPFQAAQAMAVAIASGDIDFGVTAVSGGLLNLAARGDAVRIFGGALTEAKDAPGHVLLASKAAFDAGLQSPKDLDGKRFAITTQGSSFAYMGAQIAKQEGIAIKPMALNTMPAIAAALQAGKVDAAVVQPAFAADWVAQGAAVEIGRVADFLPDYQVTVLFTSAKRAQDNPQSLAAFRRGFAKGAALYNAALVDKSLSEAEVAAVVADVHRYVFVDKPEAEAARLIQAGAMRVSPDAALNRADVLKQVQWFKEEKLVPDALDGNALLVD